MANFLKWDVGEYINMDFIHVIFVRQESTERFRIIGRDHTDCEHFMTLRIFNTYDQALKCLQRYMNRLNKRAA